LPVKKDAVRRNPRTESQLTRTGLCLRLLFVSRTESSAFHSKK
jgi:hypothetical protein